MQPSTITLDTQDPNRVFEKYLQAVTGGAFTQADQVVREALQAGIQPGAIYDRIFTPAMREVGKRWETGQMTVAQEHLATGITEYCRNLVLNAEPAKSVAPTGKVMLTSVNGNQHTLGLSLLADVFSWRGWEVFPLFSALPEDEIASAALLYQVDLVCLSVALPWQIQIAASTIRALRGSGWQGLIEVGGAAFLKHPELAEQLGADFFGGDAVETVEKATQLQKNRKG